MTEETKKSCGIVMPISEIDGCSEAHWLEVRKIINQAVEAVGLTAKLVSHADEVSLIQKTIIQNIYSNDIVIVDVSAKNANVMFELGMRLAFDKPTIIIKDDSTDYSFDTSVIEHLNYPRDLRFQKIVDFKDALSKKIESTLEKSDRDASYSAFLSNFGTFKVAKLNTEEISGEQYILEEIKSIRNDMTIISESIFASGRGRVISSPRNTTSKRVRFPEALSDKKHSSSIIIEMPKGIPQDMLANHIGRLSEVVEYSFDVTPDGDKIVIIDIVPCSDDERRILRANIIQYMRSMLPK